MCETRGSGRTEDRNTPCSQLRFLQTDAVSLAYCRLHTHTHDRGSLLMHTVLLQTRTPHTSEKKYDWHTHAHTYIYTQSDTLFLLWISDEELRCWIIQQSQREKVAETKQGFGPERSLCLCRVREQKLQKAAEVTHAQHQCTCMRCGLYSTVSTVLQILYIFGMYCTPLVSKWSFDLKVQNKPIWK